ncbi:hypothetical protein B1808_14415 [Pseudofulvimonas gallinarii]|nr:hypothetical protein [Pseudofulvimonas gallinarii]THD11514.1 hypothetical protein B1808_14415 [Pseudofulvimonas gallinarii]
MHGDLSKLPDGIRMLVPALVALALLAGCRKHVDPVEAAILIAEERCDCTRQHAPEVARCSSRASKALMSATQAQDDSRIRSAMVNAYQDSFRKCPWDDPSYYR